MTIGFVLGGGGVRGAVEIGMLQALFEAQVKPDLIVGTSIGAINGAAVAADPTDAVVERLAEAWGSPAASAVYGDSWMRQLQRLATSRIHLNDPEPLRELIAATVGHGATFEDMKVPLAVCAASIERAAEQWFDSGPLVDAVLASASVPAALPPTLIDGEHYVDGGLVNSIPLGEAIARGATEIYVLQVGRIEEPLTAPRKPSDVARVSFEIARRHRFARERAQVPDGVIVHVLPYGGPHALDSKPGSYRRMDATHARIAAAYEASAAYLALRGDA
ncbi:patatin-like phospholipase family protein [Demequina zhanjiangensis]|uniref:Patatin-like phospholipase family protein n=1 Tax=Demequina zhanjiangensis TaxID=3051659 RepID=A0ABT8G346_9MICO|nr:patatin-like phospholipase family protein [Demequina sp. SYSU T00b26]MDN4473502.1 patatin-like phospholipase family protein [Demequina sp. SYSU T00b26]